MGSVMPRSDEGPIITDLPVPERPHQQIAVAHIGQSPLYIEWAAHKGLQHGIAHIGSMLRSYLEHPAAVCLGFGIPVLGIAP
jgi:hypothetical protein